eukprot:3597579-Rhodomonas_salina.1
MKKLTPEFGPGCRELGETCDADDECRSFSCVCGHCRSAPPLLHWQRRACSALPSADSGYATALPVEKRWLWATAAQWTKRSVANRRFCAGCAALRC